MDRQNLTLLTDLYELTMMQGYFKNKDRNETVIFDAFYRNNPCDGGFAVMAGVEQLIQYIRELRFEKEDIDYLAGLGIFEQDFLDSLPYIKPAFVKTYIRKILTTKTVNAITKK